MTGSEKIIKRILDDAQTEAEAILAEARGQAEETLAKAKAEAEAQLAEKKALAEQKAAAAKQSAESSAQLAVRNAVLRQKRQEIEATKQAILAAVEAMPTEAYFELLLGLAQKGATSAQGELFLGQKDQDRCPKDFAAKLQALNITLSATALPQVVSGFVLRYGDIELNYTFAGLLEEKAEPLEDFINGRLFTRGE